MGMHRTHRKRKDREEAADTRLKNRVHKEKERARRDARMLTLVSSGKQPFSPALGSWISRKLGKPITKVTPDDLKLIKI